MGKSAKTAAPFSHAEFDALPDAVQRKYFSSLERLRIQAADQQSVFDDSTSCRSTRSRATSLSLHHPLTLASVRRRLRKAESIRQDHQVSQLDALFFQSLPEKLRKLHFSQEEQDVLLGTCDQPPLPEDHAYRRAQQRFDDFRFGFFDRAGSPPRERGRSRRRSRSISPTRVPFHRDQQEVDSSDSLLYLDIMSPPTSFQLPQPSSFARTLSLRTRSLTNLPRRTSTSSAPPLADRPLFSSSGPGSWHQRSTSLSQSGRRTSHGPVAPVFDPEATHYQDPEARKKLRMFLASPQKFDEAVEFGFPPTAGDDTIAPRFHLPPIHTDARNFSRDVQTFLKHDRMSFLDHDDEVEVEVEVEVEDEGIKSESDGESVTDGDSPLTPSSVGLSFNNHTRHASPSNISSSDSTGLPPIHLLNTRINREMTLRMTLTRPDLRADEEQLYGWQNQALPKDPPKDPFALEELHLSDDMTGSNGAFAVKPKPHGNLVSRLFKRATSKKR